VNQDFPHIVDGLKSGRCAEKHTVATALKNVLEVTKSEKTAATARSYGLAARNFVRIIGDKPLDQISVQSCDLFKAQRLQEVSPVSVNVDLSSLKAMFSMLEQWEVIIKNPFTRVKLVRVPQKEMSYLTETDYDKLTANITNGTLLAIVQCAYFTGARIGEILNLTWDSIDLENDVIIIKNHDGFITKSKKNRQVSIHPQLKIVIERLKNHQISSYVFVNMRGAKYRTDTISKMFKTACRGLGLNESIHFHGLRHTCASRLVQKGVPIYAVSKILGHSSVKVTERYAHLAPDNQKQYINLL
jgi:integrase